MASPQNATGGRLASMRPAPEKRAGSLPLGGVAENWRAPANPAYGAPVRSARWHVYLLLCGDGSLYAGVTTDLARRLAAHKAGKGARYTRSHGALAIVHSETARGRSAAQRREAALKRLPRMRKLQLAGLANTALDTPRPGQ
jgi:putative endonuclease